MPYALVGGAIAAAGAVGGSLISSSAQRDAAKQQAQSNDQAIAEQQRQYDLTRSDLQPYNTIGQNNLGMYGNFYRTTADQLGQAYNEAHDHIPQAMTEANLVNTPGYQFNLSQGLKAAQNSAAARGLGVSGAAMNSASNFATGLADSTYQNQFNNQNTIYQDYLNQAQLKNNQLNTIYNQIQAPVVTGLNAAAKTGEAGTASANAQSQLLNNTGAANAAATSGAGNTIASGLAGAGNAGNNAALNYLAYQNSLAGQNANFASAANSSPFMSGGTLQNYPL